LSLKDDLKAPKPRSGPKCLTCEWYNALSKQDRKDFDEYVAGDDFVRAHLYRVVRDKYDYPSCDSSLKYHLQSHHGHHGTS